MSACNDAVEDREKSKVQTHHAGHFAMHIVFGLDIPVRLDTEEPPDHLCVLPASDNLVEFVLGPNVECPF